MRRSKARVQGHLNYYAITDNARCCNIFVYRATRILHRWLNRKSQRKAYTWAQLNQALRSVGWPACESKQTLTPIEERRLAE